MKTQPTEEQMQALREFAEANGRTWKSKLNHCWTRAYYLDYPGTQNYGWLQSVRNEFGPTWLTRFKLPAKG